MPVLKLLFFKGEYSRKKVTSAFADVEVVSLGKTLLTQAGRRQYRQSDKNRCENILTSSRVAAKVRKDLDIVRHSSYNSTQEMFLAQVGI